MTGWPFGKIARATCAVWSGTTDVRFASSNITHLRLAFGRAVAGLRRAQAALYRKSRAESPPISKRGRATKIGEDQTRNIRDFDFMSQLVPSGRVLFYRAI